MGSAKHYFALWACLMMALDSGAQAPAPKAKTPPGPAKVVVGVLYYAPMFGHVHQNPSKYSSSLTTISCGHPVKVYRPGASETSYAEDVWSHVAVGPYEGFVQSEFLSDKRVTCFQDRYSKFFDHFDLELSELYYWGRLYDHFVQGKSRVIGK